MQNILIIGGSYFVGPIIMDKLLKQGFELTVFNRGRVKTEYPAGVNFIRGDRNNGFNITEHFDAVIDMCSYTGKQTRQAIKELKFDLFIHMGTAAAYKKTVPLRGISRMEKTLLLTEDSPLGDWPLWGDYNKGKVECEKVLKESGIKYAAMRPVYILGPHNYLPRESFIYSKIGKSEPIIIPGNGHALIQLVWANDVAESIIMLVEKKLAGAFNCAGDETITLVDLVKMMGKIAGQEPVLRFNPLTDGENFNDAEFPFANENFIVSNEKLKSVDMVFAPLENFLREDYENYYKTALIDIFA
ncbi:MAG: NAD-dependent epimerase/dehydratase family protein [Parcubacteria group bacterium]|nr:NAD-dependent epimerase/dehydratase family protein [Parcubacteria group bacterium]